MAYDNQTKKGYHDNSGNTSDREIRDKYFSTGKRLLAKNVAPRDREAVIKALENRIKYNDRIIKEQQDKMTDEENRAKEAYEPVNEKVLDQYRKNIERQEKYKAENSDNINRLKQLIERDRNRQEKADRKQAERYEKNKNRNASAPQVDGYERTPKETRRGYVSDELPDQKPEYKGVNDEKTKEGLSYNEKARADRMARDIAEMSKRNTNDIIMADFRQKWGLEHEDSKGRIYGHYLDFNAESGQIIDRSAGNMVIGTFEVNKEGEYINIKAYEPVIRNLRVQEEDFLKDTAERENRDVDSLTITYATGRMAARDISGEGSIIAEKKFRKVNIKEKLIDFQEKADAVYAHIRGSNRNIAQSLDEAIKDMEMKKSISRNISRNNIETASILTKYLLDPEYRRKTDMEYDQAKKIQLEKRLDNMTYCLGGYDFDRKNLAGYINMCLDGFFEKHKDEIDRTTIGFDYQLPDGSGPVTLRTDRGDITVAEIDKDHNVSLMTEEQILSQKNDLEKADAAAERPLFLGRPEDTKAMTVICDKGGEYFGVYDFDGRYTDKAQVDILSHPAPEDRSQIIKENIEKAMEHFSEISGVDKKDLLYVDGCSFVVTKDGKQLGILGPHGEVLADEENIRESQELEAVAQKTGLQLKDLTTDDDHNIIAKVNGMILASVKETEKSDRTAEREYDIKAENVKQTKEDIKESEAREFSYQGHDENAGKYGREITDPQAAADKDDYDRQTEEDLELAAEAYASRPRDTEEYYPEVDEEFRNRDASEINLSDDDDLEQEADEYYEENIAGKNQYYGYDNADDWQMEIFDDNASGENRSDDEIVEI